MVSGKAMEVPQKGTVLQIKQDDKFFCRLLSKENSMTHPSFRVAAVAVPFIWESQPGTPKYTFSENTLPPLTPPPSYYFNNNNSKKKLGGSSSRSNNKKKLLMALFPKLMSLKKAILPSHHSSSSSTSFDSSFSSRSNCSSSWSSSDSSSSKVVGRRRRLLSHGSSFDFRGDHDEDGDDVISPTSTLCFGIHRSSSTSNKCNNNTNESSLRM
ncbi:hypothetical protein PIB30_071340 [Stylosanthes scabra]|uniref:Uncharacterized protein n=1 Tax=Stylosanthes scabra TaxID=79078 RepID=A0ABU6UN58_9FABA|nr:hypothetical protein [Stylosanthes scabra]